MLRDDSRVLEFSSFEGVFVFDAVDAGFVDRLRDVDDAVDVFKLVEVVFSSLISSFDGVDARESLSLLVTDPSFLGFAFGVFLFFAATVA